MEIKVKRMTPVEAYWKVKLKENDVATTKWRRMELGVFITYCSETAHDSLQYRARSRARELTYETTGEKQETDFGCYTPTYTSVTIYMQKAVRMM